MRAGRGRYFSDRIDAQRVLLAFFWSHHPPSRRLATGQEDMVPLTICRLTMAVVFGLGTGAVFKLVALGVPGSGRRRDRCGGCHGGLSASSPSLLMEFVKSVTGTYTVGFVLLAVTSRLCLLILLRMGSTAARPATTAASMR